MKSNTKIFLAGLVSLLLLFVVYLNHFDNPFELDDSHTIESNQAIRNLNIKEYFKDARTFSSLPANQAYRPGLTTINAIDYALWSDSPEDAPQPKWFHISTFVVFLMLCVSLYFFYHYILSLSFPKGEWNKWMALFGAAFFAFHTSTAETVNYIIQRAEVYSTLAVIIAILIYFYLPTFRKFQLFVIPIVIGFFIKEPTIMFAPLLFTFIFLFEENADLNYKNIFSSKLIKPLTWTIFPLLVGIFLFWNAKKHTPEGWTSGAEHISAFSYLLTNFYSVLHYLFNFLLPFNLSVDTDVRVFENLMDVRILAGGFFIIGLLVLAYFFSRKKETKPAAFGILWFFITLIPTSTIFPFAEPLNDHRTFFGYIGLILTVSNLLSVWINKIQAGSKIILPKTKIIFSFSVLLICLHAFGTYKRNVVWGSEETLWKDASEKCPNSGRIWMNYGLSLMARGAYDEAYDCYSKAKIYSPYYSYLYVNFGILKNAMGKPKEAEPDFLLGLQYGANVPDVYKFYGDFLIGQGRFTEADSICNLGLIKSPYNAGLLDLKTRIKNSGRPVQAPSGVKEMKELVMKSPTEENYINLSLAEYN
ncbi:MAG: tetratricopeptide repeat protein, partial [Bacteroidota bacterium]